MYKDLQWCLNRFDGTYQLTNVKSGDKILFLHRINSVVGYTAKKITKCFIRRMQIS
jgi:hypothetical protein